MAINRIHLLKGNFFLIKRLFLIKQMPGPMSDILINNRSGVVFSGLDHLHVQKAPKVVWTYTAMTENLKGHLQTMPL